MCDLCDAGKYANQAVSPNTCVSTCPSTSRTVGDKCVAATNFVELIGDSERAYN